MRAQDAAVVEEAASGYFVGLHSGGGAALLSYTSDGHTDDQAPVAAYDEPLKLVRLQKGRDEALRDIEAGGGVFKGGTDSSAILTTDIIMDLGFVKENGDWKIDHQTCRPVTRGGFLKERRASLCGSCPVFRTVL